MQRSFSFQNKTKKKHLNKEKNALLISLDFNRHPYIKKKKFQLGAKTKDLYFLMKVF